MGSFNIAETGYGAISEIFVTNTGTRVSPAPLSWHLGLYLRNRRLIVICPRGNRGETLLHEGWRAIQDRCLQGAPWLSREQLLRGLSRRERRDVDVFPAAAPGSGRRRRE